ncbi:Nn.00g054060.m01.CDS01 [Neocucurbitaria sp. VM-36]
MQNEHGQGVSHAAGDSKVPQKVQEQAPAGLEKNLPNSIHDTGSSKDGPQTNVSHAKGGGEASIVPQKIQEKLPESIERAVPNALHDTGDTGGLHRKQ